MTFLAMYKDPQGTPRAYGRSEDRIQAEAIAKLELEAYRDEKAAVGDPLAAATFILEIIEDDSTFEACI